MSFIRRKRDTDEYNKAKSVIDKISDKFLISALQQVISNYEMQSEIIEYFKANIGKDIRAEHGIVYELPIKLIVTSKEDNRKFCVTDSTIECKLVGENYCGKDAWRNIGADYHHLYVYTKLSSMYYGFCENKPFLLHQLKHQDRIEGICREMNVLADNYFERLPFVEIGNVYLKFHS